MVLPTAPVPGPPPLSRGEVLAVAQGLFAAYRRLVGGERLFTEGLSLHRLWRRVIGAKYGVALHEGCDLGTTAQGVKVLGEYDWRENAAYLDATLAPDRKDPRPTLTLYQEVVGHGVLQGRWLRENAPRLPRGRVVTTDASLSPSTVQALDRQANLCAANAAAPMWMVDGAIFLVMDLRSRRVLRYHGPGRYDPSADGVCRAEEIPDFEEYCRAVAVRIQRLLDGLSRQAIGYRVRQSARIVWAAGARGSLRASEIPWRDDEHRGTTRASRRLLRIAERWPAPLGLVGPGHRGAERTGCPREGPQGESGGEERARVPAGPSDGARTSLPM